MPTARDGKASRRAGQHGFTLIELIIVVLILGILMAIAVPVFMEARNRARDRAAQSTLRNALTAEKAYFADRQAYTETPAELLAVEPALALDAAADATPTQGSISYALVGNVIVLGTQSASGTCFYLKDTPSGGGTKYGSDSSATCPTPSAMEATITLDKW